MIHIGRYNRLQAVRSTDFGVFLMDERSFEEVLLPMRYVPDTLKIGDEISVFVYNDSEDRPVATTREPLLQLNEFACLEVAQVNKFGAFMDWGLEKDLLVPFSEQGRKMKKGERHIIYLYFDIQSERLVGSSKLNRFFETENIPLKEGQAVEVLIGYATNLGINVVVKNKFKGLIYHNELYREVELGDKFTGYVTNIREDGLLDISLRQPGYGKVPRKAEDILQKLKENEGFLPLHDKSKPQKIADALQMSKKTFKQAIGALYKNRQIRIEKDGIYLIKN